jgi:hypothetical protein
VAQSDLPAIIPILFVAIFAAVFVVAIIAGYKRRKALREWAASKGLDFTHEKDKDFEDSHPDFKCFRVGDSRYAENMSWGNWNGWEIIAFDYHYCTGSGKNRTTHTFSGVIIEAPFTLRPLSIRPEGFFDKFTEFFGLDDIDFESAEFSRRFFVKSPERKWAYDVLHARAMEFLLERQDGKYYIEFAPYEVLIYRAMSAWSPENFEQAIDTATTLVGMIPDYVKQQMEQ